MRTGGEGAGGCVSTDVGSYVYMGDSSRIVCVC